MNSPRYDLHRHLGGSISCSTVANLKRISLEEATKAMTYAQGEKYDYDSFFKKFEILDSIQWSRGSISMSIHDAIWELKKERLDYAEIKFSVNKYLPYLDMNISEAILWVAKEFDTHASNWGIEVDLILSLKHDMDKKLQSEIGNTITNDLIAECIAGIDIVGNERFFDVEFYKPIFQMWHDAKKVCMAHVGEINKPQNVYDTINHLHVDRICHGIACASDKELAKKTRDNLIAFDICITSNICTGVANEDHPVKEMLDNGFLLTVGTDDPIILQTNYDKELSLFQDITKVTDHELEIIQQSAHHFSAKEIIKRKA